MKKLVAVLLILVSVALLYILNENSPSLIEKPVENLGGITEEKPTHPLMISQMRKAEYPGSDLVIEQTLADGTNYSRFIASYKSEGLKIYGLLTIPKGEKPQGGWPVIVFNHGYIPPEVYRPTERYLAYVDGFAKNGYVVFRPDYRGHSNSEGYPEGAYYSPAYTVDVLNALSSVKKHQDVNPEKVGMWGHSLGGHITLRSMVVDSSIKAGVIWAGVVADYSDMLNSWHRRNGWQPSQRERDSRRPSRQNLIDMFGSIEENPDFWKSIAPINFVEDISGPVQIHHGTGDETVPWQFSQSLDKALSQAGKEHEYYLYQGADHNLSGSAFNLAMSRSLEFFDKYVK